MKLEMLVLTILMWSKGRSIGTSKKGLIELECAKPPILGYKSDCHVKAYRVRCLTVKHFDRILIFLCLTLNSSTVKEGDDRAKLNTERGMAKRRS